MVLGMLAFSYKLREELKLNDWHSGTIYYCKIFDEYWFVNLVVCEGNDICRERVSFHALYRISDKGDQCREPEFHTGQFMVI